MKKILLFLAVSLLTFGAYAQGQASPLSSMVQNTGDSLTEWRTIYSPVIPVIRAKGTVWWRNWAHSIEFPNYNAPRNDGFPFRLAFFDAGGKLRVSDSNALDDRYIELSDSNSFSATRHWVLTRGFLTGTSPAAGISPTDISNWNTAYGWGNHAGLYVLLSGSYSNPSWITSLAPSKISWSGSTAQYVRGDGSVATFPSIPAAQVNSDWNAVSGVAQILNRPTLALVATSGAFSDLSGTGNVILSSVSYSNPSWLTSLASSKLTWSGSSSQYIRGDGSAATFPTVDGSETKINAGTGIIVSGSGTAASPYIVSQSAFSPTVNNAPGRSIVTVANVANGFQISSSKVATGSYSITVQATASGLLAGASSGYVVYEICPTNSSTPGDWTEIGRWTNGQTFNSLLTLSSTQPVGSDINKTIPAGYYVRLRAVTVSGTPAFTYNAGQEVIY